MANNLIVLGKKGEELVARYLENLGFLIELKNYRCQKGEVDIIAKKSELMVFVEVKLRKDPSFYLSELILPSKQKKIISTALHYITTHKHQEMIYRFDVALVELINNQHQIQYLENAFTYGKFCNV